MLDWEHRVSVGGKNPEEPKDMIPHCTEFEFCPGIQHSFAEHSSTRLWGLDSKRYSCSREEILRAGGNSRVLPEEVPKMPGF